MGTMVAGFVALLLTRPEEPAQLVAVGVVVVLVVALAGWLSDRRYARRDVTRDLPPRSDPLLDEPARLQICGVLAAADAETTTLGNLLGLDDSVVRHHLEALEDADYVVTERRRGPGGTHRTCAELYYVGRGALAAHVAELRRSARLAEPVD